MNLSPIKKIVYARTLQRLISELTITLQANHNKIPFMGTSLAEMATRISNVKKVGEIIEEVYTSNLRAVEFNKEEEMEMQNWVKTINARFSQEWITGDLLN